MKVKDGESLGGRVSADADLPKSIWPMPRSRWGMTLSQRTFSGTDIFSCLPD